MAEGTSVRPDNMVCRYFLSSSCRDGDRCLFLHEENGNRIVDNVCRYYLLGKCIFGGNCRYDHVRVKKKEIVEPQSQDNVHSASAGPSRCSNRSDCDNSARYDSNRTMIYQPTFTSLNRNTNEVSKVSGCGQTPTNWINAPEFVPKATRSYADTVRANTFETEKMPSIEFCPYFMFAASECPFQDNCPYIHGIVCELCNKACLNPFDENQMKAHIEVCEKELEQDMELSFAIQYSADKTCGICMDVIVKKDPMAERRFGILEKCNHVYCLSCIRTWRSKQQESVSVDLDPLVTRACPECRVASDFVIPSSYFVDSEEEKSKLITEYKKALNKKPCKYFKQGKGTCPFGGSCFYLHAKPDGTKVDLPPPTRRRRHNQDGELDFLDGISLWDYLVTRFEGSQILDPSDSDDSDVGFLI